MANRRFTGELGQDDGTSGPRVGARRAWGALSFTHQKEHVSAIVEAKRPETRLRRIEKSVDVLLAGARVAVEKKRARKTKTT